MKIETIVGACDSDSPLPRLLVLLVRDGTITLPEAYEAAEIAGRNQQRLPDVLRIKCGLSPRTIAVAESQAQNTQFIDPIVAPPDRLLVQKLTPAFCLQHGLLPWRKFGNSCVVLTARPDQFERHRDLLTACFGSVRSAITTQDQLDIAVAQQFSFDLVRRAENRVPDRYSCRSWSARWALLLATLSCLAIIIGLIMAPVTTFSIICGWAIVTLFMATGVKAAAAYLGWRGSDPTTTDTAVPARLPVISILVPLLKETAIADHLVARLKALDYPRALLDVCLVMEADDTTTRTSLGETNLPTWIRPVIVPKGTLKTKPRALNYALDFTRGSIIGVYDAEDAPAIDQLHAVATRFANRGQDVACLQGVLDYYNAGTNWLTRCFAVEYASWFRVVLPGMARMGLVVPLGGTTLFFRRGALEKLGGWDAHNVTEDADLGVRLARRGYRTELIDTVTEEEANGRFWPWVKQRSRWLKGYAITYAVHMRHPVQMWRDLGAWRFFGVQMLFLGTLSQFMLAPILWSFWAIPLGLPHPLSAVLMPWMYWTLAIGFVLSELVNIVAAAIGVSKAGKPWLIKWAPTLHFYFPLAVVAVYKGLLELTWKPFYWDKTAHGILLPQATPTAPPQQPLHPVSNG